MQATLLSRWKEALTGRHGVREAERIVARVRARHRLLREQEAGFMDRLSRFEHAELRDRVLPGLALYQVLREEGRRQTEAIEEVVHLLSLDFDRQHRILRLLHHLPWPFSLFKMLLRLQLRLFYSAQKVKIVEDNRQCFAFEVTRCLTHQVLSRHGAPELTVAYCRMDDILAEALPPSIVWMRTGTLGEGAPCCDFRYCRSDAVPKEEG